MDGFKKLALTITILGGLLPLSAMAADQPTAPTPAATTAGTAAATPAPNAKPEQKLLSQAFGDWVYRCLATAQPGQSVTAVCSVQQQLVLNQNGHAMPLLTITFIKVNPKGHVINVIAPLGVALKSGLDLSVDTQKPVAAAFDFCNDHGCFVVGQPAAPILKDLRTAKQGHAKLALINGRPLVINFSLKGLQPALEALDSGTAPHS